jgi:translation initiation factor 3 subunit I
MSEQSFQHPWIFQIGASSSSSSPFHSRKDSSCHHGACKLLKDSLIAGRAANHPESAIGNLDGRPTKVVAVDDLCQHTSFQWSPCLTLASFPIVFLSFIQQRPFLLQGHERPITKITYNYDGDLLFSASKDQVPSVWRSETGERLGTYTGHKGTIWDIECDRFSRRLLTASADTTVKLWKVETGECLQTFTHKGPVRGIAWAEGSHRFASISDPFVEHNGKICIYDIPEDKALPYSEEPRLEIDLPKIDGKKVNATTIHWTALNDDILVSFDNGMIRLYDPENGDIKDEIQAHEKKINRLRFNRKKTLFITSSADFTSKLYDPIDLKHLKTYRTDRPVNDAVISETKDHILLGGGQEAMSVTTTSSKVGKFVTRFFHMVYEEEFGCVKGHLYVTQTRLVSQCYLLSFSHSCRSRRFQILLTVDFSGPINACTYTEISAIRCCLSAGMSYHSLADRHFRFCFCFRALKWPSIRMDGITPAVPKMATSGCIISIKIIWK